MLSNGSFRAMNGTTAPALLTPKSTNSALSGYTESSPFRPGSRAISPLFRNSTATRLEPTPQSKFFSVLMTCNRDYDEIMKDALDSLYAQTHTNWELIFICDIESTRTAVLRYCSERELIVHCCFGTNLNNRRERFSYGLRYCTGNWICCFDSDDILHPQALEIVDRSLSLFPNLHFFNSAHVSFFVGSSAAHINWPEPGLQMINMLIREFRQRHFWGFINQEYYWPKGWLTSQYPIEDYWAFASIAMNGMPVLPIPHCLYGWRNWDSQYTRIHRNELHLMCADISDRLLAFSKRQGPSWHFGDISLAARMSLAKDRLATEVQFR